MKKSLFEMLGIADQERIHTQILAWLMTPADSPLDQTQRSRLIHELFKIETSPETANSIRVITELRRLDLVVLHPNAFIAVENKMKSRQGESQLSVYSDEIAELQRAIPDTQKNPPIKFFLTFSGEVPEDGWIALDYQSVLDALRIAEFPQTGYVSDYVTLLATLLECRAKFLNNHPRYPEIFRRSGMDTLTRLTNPLRGDVTAVEKFVCGNRLERIFVERLYRDAITKAGFARALVAESRGKALIHLALFQLKISGSEKWFHAGFQLQGSTVKLNIGAEDYDESECDWLSGEAIEVFDKHFLSCVATDAPKRLRVNKSRGRAYRSWSRQISFDANPQSMSFEAFSCFLKCEVEKAAKIWTEALVSFAASRIVTEYKSL